ncbi:MAG: hypothetical protein U0414_17830 [Polyangiaceae bacterium]
MSNGSHPLGPNPHPSLAAPPLPTLRRVFRPRLFLLGALVFVGSVAAMALLVAALGDGVRLRGSGWLKVLLGLAIAPFLGLAGMVVAFFGRGCSACRRALEERKYRYPSTMYAFLAEQLARGGPHLAMFLRAPIEAGPCGAELTVTACVRCERIGAVELADRVPGRDHDPHTEERWLAREELPFIAALRENRRCSE